MCREQQPKVGTRFGRLLQTRALVIVGYTFEAHQLLAVMRLCVFRFSQIIADPIIQRGNAAGYRMPAGHALHMRQSGKGEEITRRLHANIGINQNVELIGGNGFLTGGQIDFGQDHGIVSLLAHFPPDIIQIAFEGVEVCPKAVFGIRRQGPAEGPADGMVAKVA